MVMPVGFHCTALHTFRKYGLEQFWNAIPDVPHDELKAIFKKPIWLHHWIKDVATVRYRDSPFCMTFLKRVPIPNYPYKTDFFMKHFLIRGIPNSALTQILRFWMTPNRLRTCSCGISTDNMAKHLLFDCLRTRDLINCYRSILSPKLRLTFHPNTFSGFLSHIANSAEYLNTFNHVLGKFNYPQFQIPLVQFNYAPTRHNTICLLLHLYHIDTLSKTLLVIFIPISLISILSLFLRFSFCS